MLLFHTHVTSSFLYIGWHMWEEEQQNMPWQRDTREHTELLCLLVLLVVTCKAAEPFAACEWTRRSKPFRIRAISNTTPYNFPLPKPRRLYISLLH